MYYAFLIIHITSSWVCIIVSNISQVILSWSFNESNRDGWNLFWWIFWDHLRLSERAKGNTEIDSFLSSRLSCRSNMEKLFGKKSWKRSDWKIRFSIVTKIIPIATFQIWPRRAPISLRLEMLQITWFSSEGKTNMESIIKEIFLER